MDQRVFGPYYGTPPEQQPRPEPPLAPPEPLTRSQRMARFTARSQRILRRAHNLPRKTT